MKKTLELKIKITRHEAFTLTILKTKRLKPVLEISRVLL